jgi:hypothetical protein
MVSCPFFSSENPGRFKKPLILRKYRKNLIKNPGFPFKSLSNIKN